MPRQDELTFPGRDGQPLPAALSVPDGPGPFPAVIVIHEAFGLNDDIRRIAYRFAEAGYAAFAPDLLSRGAKLLCIARAFMDLRRGDGASFEDLEAARRFLLSRPEADPSRVGVAGFCMGGGFALLYAVRAPVGATAPFYGEVPRDAERLRGVAPVCASFGGRDRLFGTSKARLLERHLEELDVPHDVKVYPEAGHSFMSVHPAGPLERIAAAGPMRVAYHHPSAEDAWSRMLSFFAAHLGGPQA